jgi:hypothetical protein
VHVFSPRSRHSWVITCFVRGSERRAADETQEQIIHTVYSLLSAAEWRFQGVPPCSTALRGTWLMLQRALQLCERCGQKVEVAKQQPGSDSEDSKMTDSLSQADEDDGDPDSEGSEVSPWSHMPLFRITGPDVHATTTRRTLMMDAATPLCHLASGTPPPTAPAAHPPPTSRTGSHARRSCRSVKPSSRRMNATPKSPLAP